MQLYDLLDLEDGKDLVYDDEDRILQEKIADMPTKLANYHIQNNKDKFFYTEIIPLAGVDSVLYDQLCEVYVVKHKFPYLTGMQKVTATKTKVVSCVRKAIKDIEEANNQLTEVRENVQQSAID